MWGKMLSQNSPLEPFTFRRFGFANPEALAAGQTGTACRGEEHDITLVWSITSGKRLVLADGQEVHYSSSRGNVLDFSWTMRGNHVLKIVAHSAPPLSAAPGFRQYDFFVDGQSFFTFPKVFRLGLAAGDPRGNGPQPSGGYNNYSTATSSPPGIGSDARSVGLASIEAPHNPDEEEAYLQEAIKNSLLEAAAKPNVSQAGKDLLLDFFDDNTTVDPAPLAIAAQPFGSPGYGQSFGAPAAPAFASPPSYGAPAPAPPPYSNYTTPAPAPPYGSAPSYPPQPNYGGAAPLALPAPAPAFATAPPPAAADPWGAPAPATPVNSWGAPPPAAPANSWGSPPPAAPANSWAAPAPSVPTNTWTAPAPAAPMTPSYGAPPASSDPWGAQVPSAAAAYGFASPQFPAPPSAVEFSNPPPQPTPSSVGFASPQSEGVTPQEYQSNANFAAAPTNYDAPPNQSFDANPAAEQAAPFGDPALFTMSSLSGQVEAPAPSNSNLSLADQAYAKYASLGEFDLVSKKEPARENPFASAPVGSTLSLADMKAKISKPESKKPVMNSPMSFASQPGALVVHDTQQGNDWGRQAQQPAAQQFPGQQPPAYMQPPAQYGQQPPAYTQQPPTYGQQPPPQQAAPMVQPVFGQPYSQPPPVQNNPYGAYGGQNPF